MVRDVVGRIVWVGKGAVFLAGLAVIFALLFAGAIAVANAVLGTGDGTVLSIESDGGDPLARLTRDDEAGLGLDAEPVAARRQIEFPRGYAQVNVTSAAVTLSGSKGINGVRRTDDSVYCFDLTFAPRAAVASANINNNATVGTVLGNGVPSVCPAGFRDAAARTYAANDATSTPRSDINFGIVFI
jgi:hypothetical protein